MMLNGQRIISDRVPNQLRLTSYQASVPEPDEPANVWLRNSDLKNQQKASRLAVQERLYFFSNPNRG
jgi:hypothetical protein